MKKKSLDILHRYRSHLIEREQIALQDRIAEENQQKARLFQLQTRVQNTHDAKLKARSIEELRDLDESAAWLHTRITMARRAFALSTQSREAQMQRLLQVKQSRDQVEHLIENARREHLRARDETERQQIDELVTSRYALTSTGNL